RVDHHPEQGRRPGAPERAADPRHQHDHLHGGHLMADPSGYDRDYSFAGFQANSPQTPLPGQKVDAELDDVSKAVESLVAAVKDVRRSDGKLRNGIVTAESLAPDVLIGVATPVAWQTGVEYGPPDTV